MVIIKNLRIFNLKMNSQKSSCLKFSELLFQFIPFFDKCPIFSLKYKTKISLLKNSLNIPEDLPSSQEIFNYFLFLKNGQTPPREVAKKNFCIKNKTFLIWIITAFEVFSQKSFEKFVIFTVLWLKILILAKEKWRLANFGIPHQHRPV